MSCSTFPPHSQGSFFVNTIIGLTLYTAVLSMIFNAEQYRLYKLFTFVVITPIIKYVHVYPTAPSNSRVMRTFLFSIMADTCMALWVLYIVPTYGRGLIYAFFPVCTALIAIGFEALQYLLFDYGTKDAAFLVKLATNPLDNLLAVVVCCAYYLQSLIIDWDSPIQWYLFLAWLSLEFIFDGAFGLTHYYEHTVPWLWKKHKLHHEYRGTELNSFANFYAEFADAWMMNIGFFVCTFIATTLIGGASFYWNLDAVTNAVITHGKYSHDRYGLFYFWEYDAACQLFKRQRPCEYHPLHHTESSRNFAGWGFISDDVFKSYAPNLTPYAPALWKVDTDINMEKQQ